MSKQNIVIVGGGCAGSNAAKALSRTLDKSKYNLILINPLPYRIWLIGTLRLCVSPEEQLQKDVMLPYDKLFVNGNGKFVQGLVKSFEASKEGGGSVTLESGEKIE
jgi:NADH dehydrogenase FAD-containing subunit